MELVQTAARVVSSAVRLARGGGSGRSGRDRRGCARRLGAGRVGLVVGGEWRLLGRGGGGAAQLVGGGAGSLMRGAVGSGACGWWRGRGRGGSRRGRGWSRARACGGAALGIVGRELRSARRWRRAGAVLVGGVWWGWRGSRALRWRR